MTRVLVTGSTTGLGLAAAEALLDAGHHAIVHARNEQRAGALEPLQDAGADVVIGDLASLAESRQLADAVNALGHVDAVVHNAGIYTDTEPHRTVDGHPRVLAVNVLAPYLLTARIHRPARLIYLSSGMHTSGRASLDDLDWRQRRWNGTQAYCDSKLLVTTLAAAVARYWPDVRSNVVDPGWVPTRMGGPSATDDLALGHDTQVWLATSDDAEAAVTGTYWYHRRVLPPAAAVNDPGFQDDLLAALGEHDRRAVSRWLKTASDVGAPAEAGSAAATRSRLETRWSTSPPAPPRKGQLTGPAVTSTSTPSPKVKAPPRWASAPCTSPRCAHTAWHRHTIGQTLSCRH